MSIEKRRFIRFSLDIPAFRAANKGVEIEIMVRQLSVGGCLAEWDESIFSDEIFRMEFPLPNKNRLPVFGKIIYNLDGKRFGVKFEEISQFEQELLASIISDNLESAGLPLLVDPFTHPPRYVEEQARNQILADNLKKEGSFV